VGYLQLAHPKKLSPKEVIIWSSSGGAHWKLLFFYYSTRTGSSRLPSPHRDSPPPIATRAAAGPNRAAAASIRQRSSAGGPPEADLGRPRRLPPSRRALPLRLPGRRRHKLRPQQVASTGPLAAQVRVSHVSVPPDRPRSAVL